MKAVTILQFLRRYAVFLPNCPQLSNTLDQPRKITKNAVEYNLREVAILHKLNLQNSAVLITHCKILIPCLKKGILIFLFLFIICLFPSSYLITGGRGGGHGLAKFLVPMIHRFMTSHPVAELLLCFRAKHKDGRPMLFGFLVIFTHRLTELCILNAENIKKVYSRPFKQMSWPNKEVLVLF